MKLTGKIVRIDSGSDYTDGQPRAFIQIGKDTGMYGMFRFPNLQGYDLDDQIEIELQVVEKANLATA